MSQLSLSFSAPTGTLARLEDLQGAGMLAPIDLHFAQAVARLSPGSSELLPLLAAMLSRGVRLGHVCVDLRDLEATAMVTDAGRSLAGLQWPAPQQWQDLARDSAVAGTTGPIVLEGSRAYLRRFWDHEVRLSEAFARRARTTPFGLDRVALRRRLDELFPDSGLDGPNWQKIAAAVASRRALSIVTGGPGTGKTTTAVKILVALRGANNGPPPRVQLLAPTGKAAARLSEAVVAALDGLAGAESMRQWIPQAATIHRALGSIRGSSTAFRHHRDNPLVADVVVVDEASMVDLALMRRLVDAVPESARLILLGDRDQLASVEAGAVLGDICNVGRSWGRSRAARQEIAELTGAELAGPEAAPAIADCIVELRHSWRFGVNTPIGRLARAVNDGDGDTVVEILRDPESPEVELLAPLPLAQAAVDELVLDRYAAYLEPGLKPASILDRLDSFRILCAHRRGRRGVIQVNEHVETALAEAGLIDPSGRVYVGRPVLITRNDHAQGLYNGDIGVVAATEDGVRVAFAGPEGVRLLSAARLPPHETVYAMSVHKSQGSEFDSVALVLPEVTSRILSRELLYTALTRARRQVHLVGDPEVIRAAVGRRVIRTSGLRDRLWGT